MRNRFVALSIVSIVLFLAACEEKRFEPSPDKALLTFPQENSACTTGTIISDQESSITFTWNVAANSDSYELHLKNLLTNTSVSKLATANQLQVTLARNTPYSWYVISKSDKTANTAQSNTWKFYNSGAAIVSHAPFPAEVVSPVSDQNITATAGKVNLSWTGSDVDNDIAGYDVYMGTTITPTLLQSDIQTMSLNNISVVPGTNYYWKVITKDKQGNTSISALYPFKVN